MTLGEAILHSEEKAEQLCGKCAEEHAQLAEWLKELKIRRETIEAEPVRHGHWNEWWSGDCALIMTGEEMLYECSECTAKFIETSNYCPACGAKMDGE